MIQITNDSQDMEYWQIFEDHFTHTSDNGLQFVLDDLGRPIFADEMAEFLRKVNDATRNNALKEEVDKALQQQDPVAYLRQLKDKLDNQLLPLL